MHINSIYISLSLSFANETSKFKWYTVWQTFFKFSFTQNAIWRFVDTLYTSAIKCVLSIILLLVESSLLEDGLVLARKSVKLIYKGNTIVSVSNRDGT